MSTDDWTRQAGEVLAYHRLSATNGQCLCGHVVPLGKLATEHLADVLAPHVAALVRAERAAALREAADEMRSKSALFVNGPPTRTGRDFYAAWLRERADRIERGES